MDASIPPLVVGVANRCFPDAMQLPDGWAWLSDGPVLGIVAVLLVVEVVAGTIPAVDSVDDVLRAVVRPSAGGLVFGSSSTASTVAVTDPAASIASDRWVPLVAPVLVLVALALLAVLAWPLWRTARRHNADPRSATRRLAEP